MLSIHSARPAARRSGKVIAIVALMLVFLTGMVAFSIDVGYIADTRTELQCTADAAALAGVSKLALASGQSYDLAAIRTEVKKYANLNGGLTVRDEDITLLRYDPNAIAADRWKTDFNTAPPNSVRVTVRRDNLANSPLNMFFAPVIGVKTTNVQATSTAYTEQARGVIPNAPLIPYVVKDSWYFEALGQPISGAIVPDYATKDEMTISSTGALSTGADTKKEVLLYSSHQNRPGNYGSIDIGTASNGTPELERQILHGPNAADFSNPNFSSKVTNGVLYTPFSTGGDPGISAAVKDEFESIIGKYRMVPLYDTVSGNGNNSVYHVTGFAVVMITQVSMTGNPKEIWCQPATMMSYYTSAGNGAPSGPIIPGAYTRPRLVIP